MSRSDTVEEHWGVKDDGIDSSELLEHHEEEGDALALYHVYQCGCVL